MAFLSGGSSSFSRDGASGCACSEHTLLYTTWYGGGSGKSGGGDDDGSMMMLIVRLMVLILFSDPCDPVIPRVRGQRPGSKPGHLSPAESTERLHSVLTRAARPDQPGGARTANLAALYTTATPESHVYRHRVTIKYL
ncbi:hypothetical protein PoB_003038000 [Plakobranchus ocellatus]|uniref:Uncharacterized protein n=1 Tax=Plakobranchus ocellatus TaxID=259542 RepID=A0AAV4A938_9GAST|nr:hypothetical protein PoB_003038000 [Plakobranchus ocellatus]